jgi:hypothetical protein
MAAQEFEAEFPKAMQTMDSGEFKNEGLIQTDAVLGDPDLEITLVEILKKIGEQINQYIRVIYSKIVKNENLFPSICKQKLYICFNRSDVKISFKSEGEKEAIEAKEFMNILSFYGSKTCNGKRIVYM